MNAADGAAPLPQIAPRSYHLTAGGHRLGKKLRDLARQKDRTKADRERSFLLMNFLLRPRFRRCRRGFVSDEPRARGAQRL